MEPRAERRRSRRRPAEDRFYVLDNSAVFTAAIAGASGPFVFRLSAELDETVRLDCLDGALKALQGRFPFLFVSLGRGVFWHYLDPLAVSASVEAEGRWPAGPLPHKRGRSLVRVRAYGRRVAAEFHHAVTDGTGALAFLRALLAEYFVRRGVGAGLGRDDFGDILRPGEPVDPEEEEDAYDKHFRKEAPLPESSPRAFTIPGRRRSRGYRTVIGVLPLADCLKAAKERSVTLTELLTAVHAAALQDLYEERRRFRCSCRRVIAVQVPVNLRPLYPSRTLRNFFLFAAPTIDLRLGHWDFDEILRRVHHELRLGLERKELLRQIRRNVGGERHPLARLIFLPLKLLALRLVNAAVGVGAYSGSLSNLGRVGLPEPFASRVRGIDFIPSRSRATGANIGVLSWGGDLRIAIGSMAASRDFERLFFTRLASLGLGARIETNERYLEGPRP